MNEMTPPALSGEIRALLAAITEKSDKGIILFDRDFNILFSNGKAMDLLGVAFNDTGRNFFELDAVNSDIKEIILGKIYKDRSSDFSLEFKNNKGFLLELSFSAAGEYILLMINNKYIPKSEFGNEMRVESEFGNEMRVESELGNEMRVESEFGNEMRVESEFGNEMRQETDLEKETLSSAANGHSDKPSKILVVDDNERMVKLIMRYLQIDGYIIDMAFDGLAALDYVEKNPDYDLIILDIMMPYIEGYEVCRRVRESYSLYEMPVVFLTAKQETADIVKGFEAGANDFIIKPFNGEELRARAKNLISLKKLTQANIDLNRVMEMKNQYLSKLQNEIDVRKKTERELIAAKETAERANRFKSEFVANMSHEIRTPMNSILGFSEILQTKVTDSKQRDFLDAIISSGKNLLTLINDILDISKIEADRIEFQYESIDLRQVFKDIKQIFSLKAEKKGIDINITVDEKLPPYIVLDEARFRQMMLNLAGNAVKFTEKGGVEITCDVVNVNEQENTIDLEVKVKDSGIGIPDDQKELIFEAFKQQEGQSAKAYGGTGLGLTITKRLVEMMGGSIGVESRRGKGSTFFMNIPGIQISEKQESDAEEEFHPENIKFDRSLVLLVDDVINNRTLVKEFLDGTGIKIIEAENGREAIEKADVYKPDLILMDMKMPEMDGFEATKIIRQREQISKIPVIGLTAFAMVSDEQRIFKAGLDGHLRKPVIKKELFNTLMQFLTYSENGKNEEQAEALHEKEISPEAKDKIPQVLEEIKNEYENLQEKIKRSIRINAVKSFADFLCEKGETEHIPPIVSFGRKLSEAADSYDKKRINQALSEYDSFSEALKKI